MAEVMCPRRSVAPLQQENAPPSSKKAEKASLVRIEQTPSVVMLGNSEGEVAEPWLNTKVMMVERNGSMNEIQTGNGCWNPFEGSMAEVMCPWRSMSPVQIKKCAAYK